MTQSTIKDTLAQALCQIVATEFVITEPEAQKPYECDALTMFCEMPLIVVLPDTAEQVAQIAALCYQYKVPLVARGAGTGLCGGAMPHACGVLLSLTRMNQILNLNPLARTARLQPGVRNLAITEAAKPYGLYYGPDPSSQIACSIGGNVAENSGGVHCLKYGLTTHNLLSVTVVTIEGEVMTFGNQGLDSVGPDLLALITGSEGMLGIVTEVTVKLLPLPQSTKVTMAAFHTVDDAANAVSAVIAAGIIPAALEMMDSPAIIAAEAFVKAGYPTDAQALLLCELDGTPEEVAAYTQKVGSIFEAFNPMSIHVAKDEAERALFWKGRKSAFPAVGRISPDYYCMDGTIPRSKLAEVLNGIQDLSKHYGLAVANVFHAGDGNLHPMILFDANKAGEFEVAEAFGAAILRLCVDMGGCITGEHGVGVEKIAQMPVQFSDDEIAQFNRVKAAFDEHQLLNPGKGIPTLKRCQEYRSLAPSTGKHHCH